MAFPLALLLPALLPVVSDGLRAIFNRVTNGAGVQPANVAEAVQLMEAETSKMKAMAELDKPAGSISTWVADLRASSRYIAAGVCIVGGYALIGLAAMYPGSIPEVLIDRSWDTADGGFSFLFGDRMYSHLRRK